MLERVGKFEILGKLGQGGMGEVYLAKDPGLGREVALKVIGPALTQSEGGRDRFHREARAAGTLSHPNLVTVHEFGEDEGVLYLVMELLPGQDLTACLKEGSLTRSEALEVMAQVCDGLGFAHAKGILHRDIKPSNVRVWREEGRIFAKVLDFGVARLQDSEFTQTGMLVGTFQYMAPEYLQTKKADARGDLYAVGVMLHEALIGKQPEPGPTTPAGGRGAVGQSAPPPEGTQGLPSRLFALVEKAVALDPGQRFQTAGEFSKALRAAQTDPGTLLTIKASRPRSHGNTIIPSLVTSPSGQGKPAAFNLPSLALEEPEPFWKRNWGWGVLLLAVLGVAKWGFGPGSSRPSASPNPQPAQAQEGRQPAPELARNPPPPELRWALPEAQGRAPDAQPRPREEDLRQPADPPRHNPEPALDDGSPWGQEPPKQALEAAQNLLRNRPDNVPALAQVVVSYYRLGRYDDMLTALREAKAQGVDGQRLGGTQIIREMLLEEGRAHRIPPALNEAMRPFLPPRPGEQGQARPRNEGQEPHYPR